MEEQWARVMAERVAIVDYDPAWPKRFLEEKRRLLSRMPAGIILKIEHFGSTSVPGLAAKPIVDMLIEVSDTNRACRLFPAQLEPLGYDCFRTPAHGDDNPAPQLWCIRRGPAGERTHHLHVGPPGFKAREQEFRDILLARPELAEEYAELKRRLAGSHHTDRAAYTEAKTQFIRRVQRRRGRASAP